MGALPVKRVVLLTILLGAFRTGAAEAQELVAGVWTGSLELADGGRAVVEFKLEQIGDSVRVTMRAVDGADAPVIGLRRTDRGVEFEWSGLSCTLRPAPEIFDGRCEDREGVTRTITLVAPESAARSRGRRDKNALTTADLLRTQETAVYDAVRRLRPLWLRPRGRGRIGYDPVVNVYLDGAPIGDATVLQTVLCNDVGEVRFYSASEATMRFGTNNEGGAIVLTRRRGG